MALPCHDAAMPCSALAFMALPCHDAVMPCPALAFMALPCPVLLCHGCALTDQVQKRSGICIAFVLFFVVYMMQERVQQCLAGQAAAIPCPMQ